MSLFKKKNKVYLSRFCKEFYDINFLEPVVAGSNIANTYNELILDKLKEADDNSTKIDPACFKNEILSLKFEIFSLAWFHQFGDKSAINQSIYTKEYLIDKNREDLWEKAESYNKAIASSATHGSTSSTAAGRARLAFVNTMRFELFKKYSEKGLDNKCVARAVNRYGTDANWKNLSITLGYIVIELCRHLNYEPNEEVQFQLTAIMKGFYDGANQNLENIKIVND